ncbi:hypothetical protein JW935_14330 [candidate division KSB1 bacterium]|nr:hypothetical protein [candidate division KSB1 bacterium]
MAKKSVFSVLAIIVLLLACGRTPGDKISQTMIEHLDKLPQDANMVSYINIDQITKSQLYTDLDLGNSTPLNEMDELTSRTGLNIIEDVDKVYMAMLLDKDQEPKHAFFVAEGLFDTEKITSSIVSQDDSGEISTELYKNNTIYYIDYGDLGFCFTDENTLIGGSPESVKKWLDGTLDYFVAPAEPHTLRGLVSDIQYKNCAWIVMNTGKLFDEIWKHGDNPKLQGIQSIKSILAGLDIGGHLSFQGLVTCSDNENAVLFHDSIKGAVAAVKLTDTKDRKFIDLMNKIQISQSQNKIQLSFKYTSEELQKMKEKQGEFM